MLDREKIANRFIFLLEQTRDKYKEQIKLAQQQLNYLNGDHGSLCSDLEEFLGGADDATLDKLLLTIEMTGIGSPEVKCFISRNRANVTDFYKIGNMVDGRSLVPGGWTNLLDHIQIYIKENIENEIYLSRHRDFGIIKRVRDTLINDYEQGYTPDMRSEYLSTITLLDAYIEMSRKKQTENRAKVYVLK